MEVWRLDAGVATWRHGVLERWGRVEHGGMHLRRRAVVVATWRYGVLEARCRCSDVEVLSAGGPLWASRLGGMELWRRAAGAVTWRHGVL